MRNDRADFYVGCGPDAEWIGSVVSGGDLKTMQIDDCCLGVVRTTDETVFRGRIALLSRCRRGRSLKNGWPWPWDTSRVTNYAYAFHGDRVWVARYGVGWYRADTDVLFMKSDKPVLEFPDMAGLRKS